MYYTPKFKEHFKRPFFLLGHLKVLIILHTTQRATKFKKDLAKKTREINFTKKICPNFIFFVISKMTKNHFLNWQKFKTDKNAISREKLWIYFISRVFLPGLF